MTDWIVWPLFTLQFFIFLLFFVKSHRHHFRIPLHLWMVILLLVVDFGVILSLLHDSSTATSLYF